jgi:cysteinyl-tRNA synthetase
MSKSEGNVILAKDFCQKYGANTLRYLFLNVHHNQAINFSEKLIQQAENYVQKIKNLLKKLNFYLYINTMENSVTEHNYKPTKERKLIQINRQFELSQEAIKNLLNNLNTIKVLYLLEQLIYSLNKTIDLSVSKGEKKTFENNNFTQNTDDFYFILDILGFKFDLPSYDLKTKLLIKEWHELRQAKKYLEADQIRKQLQEIGII